MGLKKLKEKRSRYDDAQEEREEVKVPKKLVEEAESLDISMTDNFPLRRIKATVGEKEDNVEEADTKLKQKKKLKTHHNAPATSDPEKHKQAAIDYLKMWKKKNGEWKFQKLKQVWLLRNTYKTDMISDKHFTKYLLPYMEKLNGKAKETTLAEANKLLEANTDESNDIHRRAKQIAELLAEG